MEYMMWKILEVYDEAGMKINFSNTKYLSAEGASIDAKNTPIQEVKYQMKNLVKKEINSQTNDQYVKFKFVVKQRPESNIGNNLRNYQGVLLCGTET